jgi:hypothetical protein
VIAAFFFEKNTGRPFDRGKNHIVRNSPLPPPTGERTRFPEFDIAEESFAHDFPLEEHFEDT